MLIGSFINIDDQLLYEDYITGYKNPVTFVSLYLLVWAIRLVHILCICTYIMQQWAKLHSRYLLLNTALILQVFSFTGIIMFAQFQICNSVKDDWSTSGRASSIYWLIIEVITSYFYILSAILYLFYVSCKGTMANDRKFRDGKDEVYKQRFKYDALEYYKSDIDWFALILVPFFLGFTVFYTEVSGGFTFYNDNRFGKKAIRELHLSFVGVCLRFIQFLFMGQARNAERKYNRPSPMIWGFLAAVYTCNVGLLLFYVPANKHVVRAIIYIDAIMFFLQYVLYRLHTYSEDYIAKIGE